MCKALEFIQCIRCSRVQFQSYLSSAGGRLAGNKSSTSAGEVKVMLHNATVVTQPGDGSCMFHSLAHGMGSTTAGALRKDIAEYVAANPEVAIGGTPIKDWFVSLVICVWLVCCWRLLMNRFRLHTRYM